MPDAVITINNDYSYLETNKPIVKTKIWQALRFREEGYFHNRLYKMKVWDGYTDFIKKENGKFLTGLLPEIETALKHFKKTNVIDSYFLDDKREHTQFQLEEIDKDFLNIGRPKDKDHIDLFAYQVELTNQLIKYHRGVIQAPTSAGKTLIMISILKALPPRTPTLVLANKRSLSAQNYEEIVSWGIPNVGRLFDKYNDPNIITCANIQSLHKIESLLSRFKVLIVDEIHNMMSKEPKKYYNKLKNCSIRAGVSATPFKDGGHNKCHKYYVKGYMGPILKIKSAGEGGVLTTKKLQEAGNLSDSECIFYTINEPQLPYATYIDAVTQISESLQFNQLISKLAKTRTGRTLIIVDRIAHGDMLNNLIPGSLWVRGKDNLETRKYVIGELQRSPSVIAIATQKIFNDGINVFIHNLINAAGGQAEHLIIQRMGRGLRKATDKDILHYYDFILNVNDHLVKHSRKRVRVLKAEGHNVIVKEELDF